jgi:hypothetical protein
MPRLRILLSTGLLLSTALTGTGLEKAVANPTQAESQLDIGWVTIVEPYVAKDEAQALKQIKVTVPGDPLPPGHPCRVPSQFGYADPTPGKAGVVLACATSPFLRCMRGSSVWRSSCVPHM